MPGPALSFGPDHYTDQDALDQYVRFTYVENYVLYATATILVYELFTSLDDEVERVWPLKWRLPKIVFVLNRYVIRAMLVGLWILANFPGTSAEFCRIYAYWQILPLRLAILAAQALVVIRVWAIYNNSRPMFYLLSLLYASEVASLVVCMWRATADVQGVAQPAPLSCALESLSDDNRLARAASGTWIAPVIFELAMVLITLPRIVPQWRWRKCGSWVGRSFFGTGGNTTLDVLARDSLVYFLFIFTFSLTNALLYELNFSNSYHTILLAPTSAISCIAVSRMMINIRACPLPLEDDDGGAALGGLSFAESYSNPGAAATPSVGNAYVRSMDWGIRGKRVEDVEKQGVELEGEAENQDRELPTFGYPPSSCPQTPQVNSAPACSRPSTGGTSTDATRVGVAEEKGVLWKEVDDGWDDADVREVG